MSFKSLDSNIFKIQNSLEKTLDNLKSVNNYVIYKSYVEINVEITFVDNVKRERNQQDQNWKEKSHSNDSQSISYADQLLQTLIDCDCQVQESFEDYQ